MPAFEGCYTVLVAPFTPDGRAVDTRALARPMDWQMAEGVPGLAVPPYCSTPTEGELLAHFREIAESCCRTPRPGCTNWQRLPCPLERARAR